MKSILDPSFEYVNAASTDIRKTFAKVRRIQRARDRMTAQAETAKPVTVTPIFRNDTRRLK